MAAAKGSTKSKAKKTAEPEPTEELELEEVAEEEADAADSKKASDEVVFGVADLAKLLEKKSGKKVTTRELRTLIRKMARDGSGRVDREITAGNRTRYSWSGPDDKEVKAIIKAFDGGELEADKQAKLAELKEKKAKKNAEKKAEKEKAEKAKEKKSKGKKSEAAADDDELELDD